MVRRQRALAEKDELVRAKAKAADERKRVEKREALAKKKVHRGIYIQYYCTLL